MMDNKMFCFSASGLLLVPCTGAAGVCGKPFDVAFAQDEAHRRSGWPFSHRACCWQAF